MVRFELRSHHDVPIQEFVALQRFPAVILALFPTSCGNSMSSLLSSFFQGFGCRGMASCLSLWDAGLTEEAERMAAFGDLGCRAAGDRERVGRGGFPPWLDQPLCTPSSLFWVLEKGTGSLGPRRNPQHRVLHPYKALHFPAPVKASL